MAAPRLSVGKKMGEAVKAGCRLLARPILPVFPDSLANRLSFLGRVCIDGPDDLKLRFHTYGPYGKDRIALKLARRGFWGYEGETIRVFLPLAKQAQTVIDIGANTGLFALLAAKVNPACRVLAFEPVPFIYEMLQQNVRLNQLKNLECVPAAVSDCTGETTFFITHTSVGIPMDSSACAGFRTDVESLRVATTTLDDDLEKRPLSKVDLIKIDAEATEANVIRGASQTLRQHRPFVICEVLEDIDHRFVQRAFENLSYHFYHIAPDRLERRPSLEGSLAEDKRNYLFVPAEKADVLLATARTAGIAVAVGTDR